MEKKPAERMEDGAMSHSSEGWGNLEEQVNSGEQAAFEGYTRKNAEAVAEALAKKAMERGYYKGDDGIWRNRYGDEVRCFRLDEEYPELADKTEALADKYHVKYNDHDRFNGLKWSVYNNANELSKASDEHLASIFNIAGGISFSISGTSDRLVSYSAKELGKLEDSLSAYYSSVLEKMPENKLDKRIMKIGECLARNFNEKLVEGDFLERLADYSAEAFLDNGGDSSALIYCMEAGIKGFSENECSGRFFGEYMKYADELMKDKRTITQYDTRADALCRYVILHGADNNTVAGFKKIVFPLLEEGDEVVRAIACDWNSFGMGEGTYGIADYTEECLLSRYYPDEINKLMMIYHEIPTSNFTKFKQNRKDAARLQGTIIGGRDFIHDERPGVNEVLVAIRNYYDHRDGEDTYEYRKKLEDLEDKYHFGVLPNAFNNEAYEEPVEYMSSHNIADEGDENETALDILDRLIKNTSPSLVEAPKTGNAELDELMLEISPILNENTGEVRVSLGEVGPAVVKMNEILRENYGKQGIFPAMVSAIAFLDKMSAYALRYTDKKDLRELAFDANFKEIVRFSQLTSSLKYDENDFERKYRMMRDKFNEAYGGDGVDAVRIIDGYKILSQQILQNMQDLGKKYASRKVTARFQEAIWSGNLSDELIGLFERV